MPPKPTELGPYRLLRRIGSGGMAEVHLGERTGAEGFSRMVAIKTISAPGADGESVGLFLDEARVAAYLDHPAIVQTLDLGYENETLFIVMEYVPGPPLSRIIRDLKVRKSHLSAAIAAHVGAEVASALDYAYDRATAPDGLKLEMIHRDISPQNILLTRGGLVKLTDFGVARASTQTHRTRTGQVRGKAAYMAPEQVRAKTLDGRTDIFGLGLVLYEALTGIRAYQRNTDINSMRAILTDSVRPIAEINPNVSSDLIGIVMRALEKDPDRRWPTPQALSDALRGSIGPTKATIERAISALLDELFGRSDTYEEDEGRPVEAWQPTISADAFEAPQLPKGPIPDALKDAITPPNRSADATSITDETATPIVSPAATVTKPSTTRSTFSTQRSLAGIGLPILGVLIAVLAALGVSLWQEPIEPRSSPPETPAKTPGATAKKPPPPPPSPIVVADDPPNEKIADPRIEKRTKRRARVKRTIEKKTTPSSRDDFKRRILAAAKAHDNRGNSKLATSLRSVLMTMEMSSAPPSAKDREMLKKAESEL